MLMFSQKLELVNSNHYRLSAGRFTKIQKSFERIFDGQDPQGGVNDTFEECFSGLNKLCQITKATRDSKSPMVEDPMVRKHPEQQPKKSEENRETSSVSETVQFA